MGFLSTFLNSLSSSKKNNIANLEPNKASNFENPLVGIWNSDQSDKLTEKNFGKITMRFTDDGQLFYDIHAEDKLQRMNLVYEINGDMIISNQPSHLQEERTKFKIENKNRLIMEFDGEEAVFLRDMP